MQTPSEKLREIVHILGSQISLGWHFFVIAKFIREAYQKDRIKGAHTILSNAHLACWDASLLAVTKVLGERHDSKKKDSLSLDYLLNCIEADPSSYPLPYQSNLQKQITNHRKELRELELKIPGIWDERDRVVAHLDRKHVTNPESLYSNSPPELDDLHTAIRSLRRILEVYDQQMEAGGIWIDESQYIWNDLESLIHLMDSPR